MNQKTKTGTLALGAIGVVFGDIGTSPLYAMATVFALNDGVVKPTPGDVYGVISLVFWAITIVVTIKYVLFILRADNDGEGGIMALAHLTRSHVPEGGKRYALVMVLGVLGASLFYGDSLITPAISVLSAVEGVEVAAPSLDHVVLPIGVVILAALFVVQRFGTETVGKLFGPIMVIWFVVLAVLGIPHIASHPEIIGAISPHHGVMFFIDHPYISFVAMGAVVLAITGAEALYADMGHFGRSPIRLAWFALVFPALTLNYLGQGAMILGDSSTSASPFFAMSPEWARIPMVVLATAATLIASQAVISGAYSVSRQAERLGYFPRQRVIQTSQHEGGQIYNPTVNWLLCVGVLVLVLTFKRSEHLATAYGLAVTATLLLTTTLFLVYADARLGWSKLRIVVVALLFGIPELAFFGANLTKVVHGGWLPLLIAISLATLMFTWRRGVDLITARRQKLEGPLSDFIAQIAETKPQRVPGTAIYLHPSKTTVPLAMRENLTLNRVLHQDALIVTAISESVPVVAEEDRAELDHLGDEFDHITHVTLHFGFSEDQNVPLALAGAVKKFGLDVDLDDATYLLSRITVHSSDRPGMARWRKRLVVGMAHNAASPTDYFHLPIGRTVIMGAQVRF